MYLQKSYSNSFHISNQAEPLPLSLHKKAYQQPSYIHLHSASATHVLFGLLFFRQLHYTKRNRFMPFYYLKYWIFKVQHALLVWEVLVNIFRFHFYSRKFKFAKLTKNMFFCVFTAIAICHMYTVIFSWSRYWT